VVVPAEDFDCDLERDLGDFGVADLDRPDPEAGEPERDRDPDMERAEPDLERAGERVGDELLEPEPDLDATELREGDGEPLRDPASDIAKFEIFLRRF